jgi:hypothetical protein
MGGPPVRGEQQSTWTCLPQGFKNSPTIFGTALTSDFQAYPAEEAGYTLLQYVDDFLLKVVNHQECLKWTELLLHILWEAGYTVSQKKAQICKDQVKYLRFRNTQGQWSLGTEKENKLPTQN